jgi:lipopolysaccharide transport system permease protein
MLDRRYRSLTREIVISMFKRREQGSLLGVLWSILNPLLMLTIIYVVFNSRMGDLVEHYAVYLLVGIVVYTHFANSTSASMQVFEGMSELTANAIFPKEILVVATVLARTVEFVVSLAVCVLIAALAGVELSAGLAWLPVVVVLQAAVALAVSLVLSCLYLYLHDIQHIYQVLLRLLFFLTPIFYTMEFLGDGVIRDIVTLNPLTHLAHLARGAILGGVPIAGTMALAALLVGLMLAGSLAVFRRFEPFIAEQV